MIKNRWKKNKAISLWDKKVSERIVKIIYSKKMILVQIKRYFYTIKNLTILQIYYLLKYKIYNPKPLFKKTYQS